MKRYLAAALLALPLSQLGHALAYWLHYGRGALPRQTGGPHAYFPAMLSSAGLLLAAALLVSLLLLGLSRRLVSLRGAPALSPAWPWLPLVAVLCCVQTATFVGQEMVEGVSLSATVLGFGLIGQVPVAFAGGLALAWLSIRVVKAIEALAQTRVELPAVPAAPPSLRAHPDRLAVIADRIHPGHPRRGPPASLSNRG